MLAGFEAGDERREEQRRVEPWVPSAGRPAAERAADPAPLERTADGDERGPHRIPALRVGVEHEPRPVGRGLCPRDEVRGRGRGVRDERFHRSARDRPPAEVLQHDRALPLRERDQPELQMFGRIRSGSRLGGQGLALHPIR